MRKPVAAVFFVVVGAFAVVAAFFGSRAARAAAVSGSPAALPAPAITTTPGWECIPTTAGSPVISGGTGVAPSCAAGTTPVLAPTYVSSAIGGKPTVVFSSVNVQIVSGTGSTTGPVNGEGNLVIGYDENSTGQTQFGSHNLIVDPENGWKSYGSIIAGTSNNSRAHYTTVLGSNNIASGTGSLVAGEHNRAGGDYSSVIGGKSNNASGTAASVLGGTGNTATGNCQSIPAAPGGC